MESYAQWSLPQWSSRLRAAVRCTAPSPDLSPCFPIYRLVFLTIPLACRPPTPPNDSAILMTVHVLRDVVGEFKRIAKARREKNSALSKVDNDAPTAEDLADALDGSQLSRFMMAPAVSAISAVVLGLISLFTLPGAACGSNVHCDAVLRSS